MEAEKLHEYINKSIPERPSLLIEMEEYAKKNNVPIMELSSMEVLLQILRIQQPKAVLEIGTAIGYSALRMAYALLDTKIVSIERDDDRFSLAEQFIKRSDKQNQIHLIKGDALETVTAVSQFGLFDAIFIDAAKGQYRRFFELYENDLTPDGIIITDNVLFKGLVYNSEKIENKRKKSLVNKITQFNQWLVNNGKYDTVIIPVGDGVAISKKRGDLK
ncbi:O-methyltransferase [Bacillus aquiflavi]|uniref:tRNA 5-hydroxyuridine methyltransferase n=1 Tax=Bacillus aquiflavi TaxID=2672567 RepID=A0A6B3W068_9BACI|nr:O-methyltransferase [Bacillus aquiflavi]MBA4538535.1 O-methyltransferase [Bacillus aquiflavi]NEY82898.1 O-methyltransferase [Bacillus aquiflavi]